MALASWQRTCTIHFCRTVYWHCLDAAPRGRGGGNSFLAPLREPSGERKAQAFMKRGFLESDQMEVHLGCPVG